MPNVLNDASYDGTSQVPALFVRIGLLAKAQARMGIRAREPDDAAT